MILSVVRKVNLASQWKILSQASKNFSSSTGYTQEEIEQFRKVFRTQPSYEESIASKEVIQFCRDIKFPKPEETYKKYVEYWEACGERAELTQIMKYIQNSHNSCLLMNEYLLLFDRNNDGFISEEEFRFGMETLRVHDPRVKDISYEDFLKQADTNKDGKISVAECREWLFKNNVHSYSESITKEAAAQEYYVPSIIAVIIQDCNFFMQMEKCYITSRLHKENHYLEKGNQGNLLDDALECFVLESVSLPETLIATRTNIELHVLWCVILCRAHGAKAIHFENKTKFLGIVHPSAYFMLLMGFPNQKTFLINTISGVLYRCLCTIYVIK
ncbi:hypothetical protein Bhyg_01552 [Pseudolycoriella hygida]|uniref:EF-hand domain-containing protein n=1 Tax=Pseudolycoriella hygida TaxID=35572 RepID=A0A9Q0NB31_9DIPT|nr:hypothetical protein Bhyg_01552 [Pseudolycoriella hygida]